MAQLFLTHITSGGERWDQLALRYYGDAFGYERIIVANPSVPIKPLLPSGLQLAIPVLDEKLASTEGRPLWRR